MGTKYIIEVEDKPFELLSEDGFTSEKLYRVKGFKTLVFDWNILNMLTPYTEPDLKQVRKDAYEEGWKEAEYHYEKGYNDGYDTGLSDAWECARKIQDTGGNLNWWIHNTSASEAIEKIRQYEQEREEKITKGDVVRIKSAPEVEILVTYADEEHVSGIALTEVDGNCEIGDQYTDIVIHKVEKTGRHYEIAEVLRKMKENQ